MSRDLQLDSLLNVLRVAGLRVGISEVLRLQQVFASQPRLIGGVPRERLRSLLRAVLVKSAEDRGTFDRVCDAWIDRAEAALELHQERPQPVLLPMRSRHRETPGRRRASYLRRAAMATALMVLLIAIDKDARVQVRETEKLAPVKLDTTPGPSKLGAPVVPPAANPRQTLPPMAGPLASSTTSRWISRLRPEIALAAFAWLGVGGLWLALRRRRLLPKPEPLASAAGPLRAFPISVAPVGAVLLAPRDQEGLAWGIGRFVAEEPTRRLDLTATVRATALAGGWPEMRFHKARFYREVWLWVDEEAEDPALPLLAEEIEAVLASHGLPVERAAFRGVPHRLVTVAGQVFAPNEIDERRDAALVAILTDGCRLTRRYAADDQRVRIDALLRSLSHWPHLAFVDASREGGGLAAILGRHGIKTIAPDHAAAFLAGAASRPSSRPNREEEAAWAAVCALCPAPVEEATALELRRRLGLAASPYSLQTLRAEAPGPPGRLSWRAVDRIRRVSWLREAEAHREGKVTPGSLLGRALDFWEMVYERSIAGEGTSAERFLWMERALLGLWRKPANHIAELYRLYQGPLRETIRQHCQALAPADWGGAGLIHLPWTWAERTPVERAMLQEMQLGGGMPPVGLRRPGRAWLGVGLLVGLGLAAVGMGTFQSPQRNIGLKTTCPSSEIEENGFTFVRICSGTFMMGSDGDPQAEADEQPVHQVELAEFWMNKFEVTNDQYREVHPDHEAESNLPVMVTWTQAYNFCKRFGYRLPTEAQWEYAARAGTETQWSFGSDEGALSRFAWANESISGDPHPVGRKGPNPWGLHDMHGNVWEWVEDWYGLYSKEAQVNPTGPSGGPGRIVRGGSFDEGARNLRSAARAWSQSENPLRPVGFRCVRDPHRKP